MDVVAGLPLGLLWHLNRGYTPGKVDMKLMGFPPQRKRSQWKSGELSTNSMTLGVKMCNFPRSRCLVDSYAGLVSPFLSTCMDRDFLDSLNPPKRLRFFFPLLFFRPGIPFTPQQLERKRLEWKQGNSVVWYQALKLVGRSFGIEFFVLGGSFLGVNWISWTRVGGNSNMLFVFTPNKFDEQNIFQMGWFNHQLLNIDLFQTKLDFYWDFFDWKVWFFWFFSSLAQTESGHLLRHPNLVRFQHHHPCRRERLCCDLSDTTLVPGFGRHFQENVQAFTWSCNFFISLRICGAKDLGLAFISYMCIFTKSIDFKHQVLTLFQKSMETEGQQWLLQGRGVFCWVRLPEY